MTGEIRSARLFKVESNTTILRKVVLLARTHGLIVGGIQFVGGSKTLFISVVHRGNAMKNSLAASLLFTVLVTSSAFAELNGNGWLKLDRMNQLAYMQGVLDVATTLDQFSREAAKNKGQSVREYWNSQGILGFYASVGCDRVSTMPPEQKLAIIQKYVNDKPDRWDYPMTFIIQYAFYKFCEE